jgi:hypothetical protein
VAPPVPAPAAAGPARRAPARTARATRSRTSMARQGPPGAVENTARAGANVHRAFTSWFSGAHGHQRALTLQPALDRASRRFC